MFVRDFGMFKERTELTSELKISVVMATYNGQSNIIQQLDSLRKQTKKINEVLIWDDCSTDNTTEIIQTYINKYNLEDYWKLKVNKKNVGWRKNFIDLLQAATGDLIFTCDQDDIWNIEKIESMSECFLENSQISVLVSDYDELVEPGGLSEELKTIDTEKKDGKEEERVIFNRNNMYLRRPGCVYAVKKEFVKNVIQYTELTKNPVHDQAMWGSAILSNELYLIRRPLISWRKHGMSSFKKEIDIAGENSPYITRLNDLKRRYERLMGSWNYLQQHLEIPDFQYKKTILINTIKELDMRIRILDKKSFISIFGSFFKYKKKFYFFTDTLHLFRYKKSQRKLVKKDGIY